MKDTIIASFRETFSTEPDFVVRSPGRVNLIGEHTDYNDGFVFPMALEQATWLACSARDDHHIVIHSINYQERKKIDMQNLQRSDETTWDEYIKGVVNVLQQQQQKPLFGFNAMLISDVPMGAGLSSSASFELGIACALCAANDIAWNKVAMATLCQQAENQWVGVNCGIMDQLICSIGEKGCAVMIDCRDLSYQSAPLPKNTKVVILDTSTRRGLVESAYNERREQCETAAKVLGIPALRDISLDTLLEKQQLLDEVVFRRARHVVSENERVQQALRAMHQQDTVALGELLKASHHSLAQDYEVTNNALNAIVDCANAIDGCYGARMTGAGFGGCAVALVDSDHIDAFIKTLNQQYTDKTGLTASVYVTTATQGCCLADQ